ncbi:MAG: type II toxin-antitoxin system VapC family toxin [Candidatus Omnitrophica bacterium]|nr:type II toxin-antitoxin system VapC family toxin [Candidatus Omnitrophota bacterium]
MTEVSGYVLDASVVIKLFVDEPLSDQADSLLNSVTEDNGLRIFAPDLLYPECANILWKYTKRFGMSQSDAANKLEGLYSLPIDIVPVVGQLPMALEIALNHDISVYDACYVATSISTNAPLVTADNKLKTKVDSDQAQVLSLAEVGDSTP